MYWLRRLLAIGLLFAGIIGLVWSPPYITKELAALMLIIGLVWAHFLPAGLNIDNDVHAYSKEQAQKPIPLLRSPIMWVSMLTFALILWMFKN